MTWIAVISSVVLMAYLIVLMTIRYGSINKKKTSPVKANFKEKISVIIAARNEAENIENVLSDLANQSLSNSAMEVIVVDDHSTDNTIARAKKLENQLSLSVISLSYESGKKAALKAGTNIASGEILVFTDADVRLPTDWLISLGEIFSAGADWVSGLVKNDINGSMVSIFQAYDQASLMAITHASFSFNKPGLASGANLALRKNTYEAIQGYNWPSVTSSGDDVLLLDKVVASKKYKLKFTTSKSTTVNTAASPDWSTFLEQRTRWAANSLQVKSPFIKWTMAVGVLANLWFLALIILSIFIPGMVIWMLIFFGLKASFEALAIYPTLKVMDQHKQFFLRFPLVAFLHPFYILTAGILGIFAPHNWKGRTSNERGRI